MRTVITYGTFDLFHIGHLRLLARARDLGDRLVVAISTDAFNAGKGKKTIVPYAQRAEIVSAIRLVDEVIPENSWEQKRRDIIDHKVNVFVMGEDWRGKFDELKNLCDVVYLPRTKGISSTEIKQLLAPLSREHTEALRGALETIGEIISRLN